MTEKKQRHLKKGWIIAAAAVLILLCALFTVNAATNGALFDGRILQGLRVRVGDREYVLEENLIDVYTVTDENGETVVRHQYDLPNDVTVYADVAEDYTAFAVDAAESVRIAGGGTNAEDDATNAADNEVK